MTAIPTRTRALLLSAAFLLILALWRLDLFTGPEISVSIFYLLPIFSATWYGGPLLGLVAAVASGAAWLSADMTQHVYSHPGIPYWNAGARCAFFVTIVLLLTTVRRLLLHEQLLARTDVSTGLANRRAFLEMLALEVRRARRHQRPLTVAYLDIDDFKAINDELGHGAGDRVLRRVGEAIRENLRAVDCVGRLGGDEFAIYLEDTDCETAERALRRIWSAMKKVVQGESVPVTFSIGAVTFPTMDWSVTEMLDQVDALMYEVKQRGKDNLRVEVAPDRGERAEGMGGCFPAPFDEGLG